MFIQLIPWWSFAASDCGKSRNRVADTATTCKTGVCESGGYVHLTSSSGFLASPAGSLSGCGSPSCPWVLSPPRGQRFNLTFYNFVQIDTNRQHHQQQQQQASYNHYLTTAATSSFYSSLYRRLVGQYSLDIIYLFLFSKAAW